MSLNKVANFLKDQAIKNIDAEERDSFGRSAYNRFYYCSYLEVRGFLSEIEKGWGDAKHSAIPDILHANFEKKFKSEIKKAQRNSDKELVSILSNALEATKFLKSLLEDGYASRVVADYKPEIKVIFYSNNFSLNAVDVEMAKQWPVKTQTLVGVIKSAWRHVND